MCMTAVIIKGRVTYFDHSGVLPRDDHVAIRLPAIVHPLEHVMMDVVEQEAVGIEAQVHVEPTHRLEC